MSDRPNPEEPEQHRDAAPPVEPVPQAVPVEPVPAEPTPPLPSEIAEPAPEPESRKQDEAVEAEPHTSVEAVADPADPKYASPASPNPPGPFASGEFAQVSAPEQIPPAPGAAPIPMDPEPSGAEPVAPDSGAPIALTAETETTLALPPTTKEVEPAPAPSAPPPPPTGVPVPFAAPPTGHPRNFGLKLGLGIGGGALAVIAIVVAIVVAVAVFANSIGDKVEGTAEAFIGAVAEDDWDTAYAMLCESYRQRPAEDYINEWDAWDAEGAEIGQMNPSTGNVTVEFDDGTAIELVIAVEQTAETLDTSVCGWRSTTV
ncbi:hypothetical protein [Glycomyces rhizosphaerae]|uniref:DUF4878 domain-containing protein n=1 Tax=Glycomyces rhizosphaerae TaxID=2054422 RepID=A0ABV7Q508_9ACTN